MSKVLTRDLMSKMFYEDRENVLECMSNSVQRKTKPQQNKMIGRTYVA